VWSNQQLYGYSKKLHDCNIQICVNVGSDKLLEEVCCEIWQNGAQFQAKTDSMRLLNPTPLVVNVIKLFSFLADDEAKYARVFVPVNHFLV